MTVKLNREKDKIYDERMQIKKMDKRTNMLIHKAKHYEECLVTIDEENAALWQLISELILSKLNE